jgi:hypothetical protein
MTIPAMPPAGGKPPTVGEGLPWPAAMSDQGHEELLEAVEQRLAEARLHYDGGDRDRFLHALNNASMLLGLLIDEAQQPPGP